MEFTELIEKIPGAKGTISKVEMKFLYDQVIKYNCQTCIEIGIASGVSSAIIVGALNKNRQNNKIENPILYSYDLMEHCYWNRNLKVGYAAKVMLRNLEEHNWNIKTGTTCLDLKKYHKPNSIDFVFIDANHRHPWPALDMIACLPYVKDDGIICLHDINLPKKNPKFVMYGAQKVFDSVDCEKFTTDDNIPNCGSIVLSNNKEYIKEQMYKIIDEIEWQIKVEDDVLSEFGITQA